MVGFCDADAAKRAMFAAGGLDELAGAAGVVGTEEDVVVRVGVQVGVMIGGRDVVGFLRYAEVGQDVGSPEEEWNGYQLGFGEERDGRMEEEVGCAGQEGQEDYLEARRQWGCAGRRNTKIEKRTHEDDGVLLVEQIVCQPGQSTVQSAIGISAIEAAKGRRHVDA